MRVGFATGDTSLELNRLLTGIHLRAMLQVKDNRTLDMLLSFVTGFVNRATGLVEQKRMTRSPTKYSDQTSFKQERRALK